jgi:hypothetical protein
MNREQAGQALVEMALATPVALLLIVGIADVGMMSLRSVVAQGAAQTAAGMLALDVPRSRVDAVLSRAGCASGELTVIRDEPELRVTLVCPYQSITAILPSQISVGASVIVAPTPSEVPS